jgi:hypothetical protein
MHPLVLGIHGVQDPEAGVDPLALFVTVRTASPFVLGGDMRVGVDETREDESTVPIDDRNTGRSGEGHAHLCDLPVPNENVSIGKDTGRAHGVDGSTADEKILTGRCSWLREHQERKGTQAEHSMGPPHDPPPFFMSW